MTRFTKVVVVSLLGVCGDSDTARHALGDDPPVLAGQAGGCTAARALHAMDGIRGCAELYDLATE